MSPYFSVFYVARDIFRFSFISKAACHCCVILGFDFSLFVIIGCCGFFQGSIKHKTQLNTIFFLFCFRLKRDVFNIFNRFLWSKKFFGFFFVRLLQNRDNKIEMFHFGSEIKSISWITIIRFLKIMAPGQSKKLMLTMLIIWFLFHSFRWLLLSSTHFIVDVRTFSKILLPAKNVIIYCMISIRFMINESHIFREHNWTFISKTTFTYVSHSKLYTKLNRRQSIFWWNSFDFGLEPIGIGRERN